MSNLIEIANILPLFDVDLPKCPHPVILQTLDTILKEFFTETQAWTLELDRIKVKEDVREYDLESPSYARIDTVKTVFWDGRELHPFTGYTLPNKYLIRLTNKPSSDTDDDDEDEGDDENDGLFVEVVLRPCRGACVVPCDIYDTYDDIWAYGVKSILMDQEGKAWYNPKQAGKYRVKWIEGKNKAKNDQERGGMNTELTAQVSRGHEFE